MNNSLGMGIVTGVCIVSLLGCSANTTSTWVANRTIQPSSLPNSVIRFVDKAGGIIGDSHPKITSVTTDYDVENKPMYRLVIFGDFRYGGDHATELPMIVLADGSAGAFVDPNLNTFDKINLNK